MYGENRDYPQRAHLLVPLGVMIIGLILAITHNPLWWLLVAAFAGRALFLLWLMNKRNRRSERDSSTVAS
ncbi:MAG: hypothetical protein Q4G35_04990 [Propionibacteriaceae bacterium]|nr:hypothetical protein [Propionibacteriaceae bacterium]